MINKIIRNYIAKRMAGRSDDGIMITLKDPQKVVFAENIMMDLLLRNGIDPRAITNETQLKNILQQIENARIRQVQNIDVSGIKGARPAQILDMEGKEIPPGSRIMGGRKVDDDFDLEKGLDDLDNFRVTKDAAAAKKAIDAERIKEAELKTKFEKQNKDSVQKILDRKNLDQQIKNEYDKAVKENKLQNIRLKDGRSIKSEDDFREYIDELNEDNDFATGGRVGYFMGSQFPKGLAALKQMLNFMGKKSDKVKNPSDVLKMVNPKSLNPMLNDPKLQGKLNVKEGILATDTVKNFQNKMGEDRVQLVKDMLSAAKNIRGADTNQLRLKNEMIEDMMKKGVDRQMAEEMATVMSRLAEDMTGKFKDTPKLTDEGILELENILKNMETGNKPKRDLNADGGRIGLKDGMNRRTFMKFLAGLASLPIVGKIVKPLKTVKGVKNVPIIKTGDVPGKPEWFDQLVNKVIIEGEDVTKRFATQDRQVVHMKKIDDETSVTVTQDLNDGSIMVDIDDPIRNVMGEGGDDTSVMMMLKKGQADETTKVKPADEFSFTENDMRNYMDGPDDYTTEFTDNTVNKMSDLTSDLGKIKSYATGKKPTMKEFIESKKRKDKVAFAERSPSEYAAERAPDIDYSDYDDGMASGGIAGMLGE